MHLRRAGWCIRSVVLVMFCRERKLVSESWDNTRARLAGWVFCCLCFVFVIVERARSLFYWSLLCVGGASPFLSLWLTVWRETFRIANTLLWLYSCELFPSPRHKCGGQIKRAPGCALKYEEVWIKRHEEKERETTTKRRAKRRLTFCRIKVCIVCLSAALFAPSWTMLSQKWGSN